MLSGYLVYLGLIDVFPLSYKNKKGEESLKLPLPFLINIYLDYPPLGTNAPGLGGNDTGMLVAQLAAQENT